MRRGIAGLLLVLAVLAPAGSAAAAQTFTVNCAQHPLQPVITAAPSGSTILASGTCHGNFYIAKNLTLSGNPTATLDGDNAGSVITSSGFRSLRVRSLVITGGQAANGGGLSFGGGQLTLDHVSVHDNSATGASQYARGGGIYTSAPSVVTITHSTISNNEATVSGTAAETATGGGLSILGLLTISSSTLRGNTLLGVSSDNAGIGAGAALAITGSLRLTRSTVASNQASGQGPQFGLANGGAVNWVPGGDGDLTVDGTSFRSNKVSGTSPGDASAQGGAVWMNITGSASKTELNNSLFKGNGAVATSSAAHAEADGGAIYATASYGDVNMDIAATTFDSNSITASGVDALTEGGALWWTGHGNVTGSVIRDNTSTSHATTGTAQGQGSGLWLAPIGSGHVIRIATSTIDGNLLSGKSNSGAVSIGGGGLTSVSPGLRVTSSTVSHNAVDSVSLSGSAESVGGGIEFANLGGDAAADQIVNSTVAANTLKAQGSGYADSAGGGIAMFKRDVLLRYDTLARNHASASATSTFAGGGGLYVETDAAATLTGTVLELNGGATGANCRGTVSSSGYNLLGSLAGCTLTKAGTDRSRAKPGLGSLGDHGGPTATISLLKGSAALDRVPTATCHSLVTRDQRGVHRPQGSRCDIGAFERRP